MSDNNLILLSNDHINNNTDRSKILHRGFSNFMSFAFCFTAVSVMPSISIGLTYSFTVGGPIVMIFAWIICSFFTFCVALSMAEICSVHPSAGSVYHWAGQLANSEDAPFWSFFCGWFNLIGNASGDAAFASGFATLVAALFTDGLSLEITVGISVCLMTVWSIMNIARTDQVGWLNSLAAIFQLVSAAVIVITILILAPDRASAHEIFTDFNDATNIGNGTGQHIYLCLLGTLGALFAFSGYEAGTQMAEETQDASTNAPMGLIYTIIVGSLFGFIYIIGILIATPDVNEALNADSPIIYIFNTCAGETGGLLLSLLLILGTFFAGMSSTTVTARIFFAMVRDDAIPGKRYLYHLHPVTKSPILAVLAVYIMDTLLLLLPLINTSAFTAIISCTTIGFQISYAIPILLRVTHSKTDFTPGPVSIGKYSILVGWLGGSFLVFTSILLLLPTNFPVTLNNMNWTSAVIGGLIFSAWLYWIISARYFFTGPVRFDSSLSFSVVSAEKEDYKV